MITRLSLVLALIASLAAAACSGPASAASVSPTPSPQARMAGVAIPGNHLLWESDAALAKDLDDVVATGATWLRFDVPWSELEPYKGGTDWPRLDRVVNAAHARGLRVVGILTTLSMWARPADRDWSYGPSTDAERDAFASFAAAAARRYAGRIDVWEIWNEPNLPGAWQPGVSADDYVALLARAAPAIRAANPRATILTGGTGGATGDGSDIHSDEWVRQLYERGARPYFDAVAVHPYPDPGYASVDHGEMARAFRTRALMDANGDSAKAIWGTETGIPSGGGHWSVSEQRQAQMVSEVYGKWNTMRNAGPLMWFTLVDFDRGGDREGYFGLVRLDGSRKPAFGAMQSMMASGPGPAVPGPVPGGTAPAAAGSGTGAPAAIVPLAAVAPPAPAASAPAGAAAPGAPAATRRALPARAWVHPRWRGR